MTVVMNNGDHPTYVNRETVGPISKSVATVAYTECIHSVYPPRYSMTQSHHECVSTIASRCVKSVQASAISIRTRRCNQS